MLALDMLFAHAAYIRSLPTLIGVFIATVLVEQLGRRRSSAIQFFVVGVAFLLLFICAGE